ncbi:hypothetical protein ACWZHB_07915 [Nocardia sp. FBN12]|uniref:hypothetical protein n=1 Tax=Nocardia sp. FBN12 TaxID=3419766 RepID=UPI003CFEBAEA
MVPPLDQDVSGLHQCRVVVQDGVDLALDDVGVVQRRGSVHVGRGFGLRRREVDNSQDGAAVGSTEIVSARRDDESTADASPAAVVPRPEHVISVNVSTAVRLATVVALIAAVLTAGGLWLSARGELTRLRASAADEQRFEQIATEYALGASNINYQDVNAWVAKLKANTTPQLTAKFDATAPKLQEILVPLKWTSTAAPIAAEVMSTTNGIDKVNVFLTVNSTSAQTPEGSQMTITYSVTVDRNNDWKITDVGGLDSALPSK